MYTFIIMSSGGKSFRQHPIGPWHLLLFALAALIAVVGTVGGIGYGLHEKNRAIAAEKQRQNSLEKIERLEQEKLIVETELKNVEAEMNDIRDMAVKVKQGLGLFGQGGGTYEPTPDAQTDAGLWQPANANGAGTDTETYNGNSETQTITPYVLRQEVQPLYDYVVEHQAQANGYPSILPVQLEQGDGKKKLVFWYSSPFGQRIHPLTKKREFHRGLDIKTRPGVPVIAAADGTVTKVKREVYLGKMVEINHTAQRLKTLYAHLQGYADGLKPGQQVKRGQVIGYVGNTGRSTGAHLHYGVYDARQRKWVNPIGYILDQEPVFKR